MFADPLASFSIPGLESLVKPVADALGYTVFAKHASEMVLATAFYHGVFIASRYLSPYFLPSYRTLTPKTRVNFDIHVVSHVQSILIVALSYPLFGDKVLAENRVYSYTPYAGFITAMALGYFLWDIFICVKFIKVFGVGFLVHGVSAFFVFLQSTRPFLLFYSPHFLLFELSTPFLNVNWFASHLPEGTISFTVQKINGVLLLSTFFFVRIAWGFYQAFRVAYDVLYLEVATRQYPLWVAIGVLAANLSLDFLNVFWFYKMVLLAKRALSTGSGRSSKKTD
ncbi:uncharacterized protein SAPINGB_P002300 [Magnusiomyces paraingens]|uniref:TLC domain-containing protein n=1 Tax=Magnusiomyces paraingens TaxID=2606893 RepID=A0A5E8BFA6_9ASCO|nr:uncharacterized protein SAPINGB_P002300 [Saprochaete ingens]VVT49500.1 unnamed protein product [Saprochaete ingens]